jgi:hypothetical protein
MPTLRLTPADLTRGGKETKPKDLHAGHFDLPVRMFYAATEIVFTDQNGKEHVLKAPLKGASHPPKKPKEEGLCHYKDAGNFTLRDILAWSIMECDDPQVTDEIQQISARLKLLISKPTTP